MGLESMPSESNGTGGESEQPVKWLKFTNEKGMLTEVAVFPNETDEDAMARMRSIDDRIAKEGQ